MRAASTMVLVSLLGCGPRSPTPAPDFPVPISAGDRRHQLVGEWAIAFTLDSSRRFGGDTSWQWRPAAPGAVSQAGRLWVSDTVASRHWPSLQSVLTVDFEPLLGRQMSCYHPGPGQLGLEMSGDRVDLWFTPDWADCGFGARVRWEGDSILVGEWAEDSFGGVVSTGKVRLRRNESD